MMWSEKYLSFATFIYVIIIINNIIEISHSMKCDVGTEYFEDRNEGPMCKECNVGDYNDVPLSDNPSCKNCPNDKPYTHSNIVLYSVIWSSLSMHCITSSYQ